MNGEWSKSAKGAVIGGLIAAAISVGMFALALVRNNIDLAGRALTPLVGAIFWFVVAWLLH